MTQHNSFTSKVTVGDSLIAGNAKVTTLTVGTKKMVGFQQAAIANVASGSTSSDGLARSKINQILVALRAHGLIAP